MSTFCVKRLIILGWILFCSTVVQASGLSYVGVDPQGQPASSQITITEQQGDLFLLQIQGGMPDVDVRTGQPYVRKLQFTKPEPTQAYAIFYSPFLYVFTPAQVTNQKLLVNVTQLYVFAWQGQEQFKLLHFFREGKFCDTQVCTDGLFCDALQPSCQLKSETISFDSEVTYVYQ